MEALMLVMIGFFAGYYVRHYDIICFFSSKLRALLDEIKQHKH